MSGQSWEAAVAAENQSLLYARRAMVARVPTHYHSGPSRDPKVDFVGVLRGGRFVAIEAKSDSGALTRMQRAYLKGVTRFGGLALVYRRIDSERYLCVVDGAGEMEPKSDATRVTDETWLDAAERRGL